MPLRVDEASFDVRVVVPERKGPIGAGGVVSRYDHVFSFVARYAQGVGVNRIGAVYSVRASITSHLDVDLASDLVSVLDGSAVTLPIIMGLWIRNLSEVSGQYVTIGQGVDDFATWLAASEDCLRIGAGGYYSMWSPVDGFPTNGDTADILRIAVSDDPMELDVLIVGRAS